MCDNGKKFEMSLQEKAICLAIMGRQPELPYPLKDVECADETVQRVYDIPDGDKAKMLADLYPLADAPGIDDVLFDLHERKTFRVRDFLVIRWGEGNLIASPYFPRSGGMFVDWIPPEKANASGCIVDVKVMKPRGEM